MVSYFNKGNAYAYIFLIENKVIASYLSVETDGKQLFFDLKQNPINYP